jgi:hypothetical protein
MSLFQAEMPAIRETFDWLYLNFAFKGNLTRLHTENELSSPQPWMSTTEYYDALTYQGMLGGQIKLTKDGSFYLPVFAAVSVIGNEYLLSHWGLRPYVHEVYSIKTSESAFGVFAGSGLIINGGLFEGGIFAGYYYGVNDSSSAVIYYDGQLEENIVCSTNSLPFKIAFMPAINTNQLANVGGLLDKVIGFVGMGELVEVFSGEEQQEHDGIKAIIEALNYGLDFVSSKFFLPLSAELDMKVFYRRDQYDSAARTDTYGAMLFFKWFRLATRIEGGYKHFYSVARNFESRYFDTGYIAINTGFQFHKNFSLMVIYNFDAVIGHRSGLGFDFFVETATIIHGENEKRGIDFMEAALRLGY